MFLMLGFLSVGSPSFGDSDLRPDAQKREQAKEHFKRGEASFRAGDFRAALASFVRAEALVPSPILTFNMGMCHERLGELEQAVDFYRVYLERRGDASNRVEVLERIARLEEELARAKRELDDLYQELDDNEGRVVRSPETGATPGRAESRSLPAEPLGNPGLTEDQAQSGQRGSERESFDDPGRPRQLPYAQAKESPLDSAVPVRPIDHNEERQAPRPVYKEWWFWAVVGVSAVILIDIARTNQHGTDLEATSDAVLFRF